MATEERIVEVTGLLADGEYYPTSRDSKSARAEFIKYGDPPINVDKQGEKRTSLSEPWK